MRIAFNVSDATLRDLRDEAARRGQTVAEVVEAAVAQMLGQRTDRDRFAAPQLQLPHALRLRAPGATAPSAPADTPVLVKKPARPWRSHRSSSSHMRR